VAAQVSTLHSWAERLLDQESWQPLSRAKGCARRVGGSAMCVGCTALEGVHASWHAKLVASSSVQPPPSGNA